MTNSCELTFADIEILSGLAGVKDEDAEEAPDSPLAEWYARVRKRPLREFNAADICTTISQTLYLKYTVLVALDWLRQDLLTGPLYKGQLLHAMGNIREDFWCVHDAERAEFEALLHAVSRDCRDFDQIYIRALLNTLERSKH